MANTVCNWRCVGCTAMHAVAAPVYVVGVVGATFCLYACCVCNAFDAGCDRNLIYWRMQQFSIAVTTSMEGSLFYDPTKVDWKGAPVRQTM